MEGDVGDSPVSERELIPGDVFADVVGLVVEHEGHDVKVRLAFLRAAFVHKAGQIPHKRTSLKKEPRDSPRHLIAAYPPPSQ